MIFQSAKNQFRVVNVIFNEHNKNWFADHLSPFSEGTLFIIVILFWILMAFRP
jgi:hypothetical protein